VVTVNTTNVTTAITHDTPVVSSGSSQVTHSSTTSSSVAEDPSSHKGFTSIDTLMAAVASIQAQLQVVTAAMGFLTMSQN